jgi:hypothetical protein
MKKLILLLLATLLVANLNQLMAQCTTLAGAIATDPINNCEEEPLAVTVTVAPTLDANDLVRYLAFTGATPQSGTVIATSTDGNFDYSQQLLTAADFKVAAVAGNDNGNGGIDFNDPCLSVSAPVSVKYWASPTVSISGFNFICQGSSTVFTAIGGQPNGYQWLSVSGAFATTPSVTLTIPGVYTVVVTNAAGCTASATRVLSSAVNPQISVSTFCTSEGVVLNPTVTGAAPPYTYTWIGPMGFTSNFQDITVPPGFGGNYCLTVTNGNGCISTFCTVVENPLQINLPENASIVLGCESISQFPVVATGGTPPYSYQWSYNGGPVVQGFPTEMPIAGTYNITVTDVSGCSRTTQLEIIGSPSDACTLLRGKAFYDANGNCLRDPGEIGVAGVVVKLSDQNNFYGISDDEGNYKVFLLNSGGTFTFDVTPPNELWELCPFVPSIGPFTTDTTEMDIPLQPVYECPLLSVDLSTGFLRRCFDTNTYRIFCQNEGVVAVDNAYVELDLDSMLILLNATIPYTTIGAHQYRFELGTMEPGEWVNIVLGIEVSCDSELGQAHCSEARIYPTDDCVPQNPLWSGASVQVSATCTGNEVQFLIENVGDANMTVPLDYIVIEDGILLMQVNEPGLAAGTSKLLNYTANGSTWYVGVEQEVYHPNYPNNGAIVAAALEGCTSTGQFSTGFLNQFDLNDPSPYRDIDCMTNIGSFDPNDKLVIPTGYGPQHYIEPETELNYTIRFQNTGTDTAFTVVILDTLDIWLDPTTFRQLGTSHPCKTELLDNGILIFRFAAPDFTGLPDSNVNVIASNGFVKFSIQPKSNVPLETIIRNRAGIYFDYNEPIITNTVEHTIGRDFLVTSWIPTQPIYQVLAQPNPATDRVRISIPSQMEQMGDYRLQLTDALGRQVETLIASQPVFHIDRKGYASGIYAFTIMDGRQILGVGQLIFE